MSNNHTSRQPHPSLKGGDGGGPVTILGIESSCDDTSAAVIRDGYLLSNVTASQAVHEAYGGVVPELASRAHQQNIVPVVDQALKRAGVTKEELSAVAFTRGPGLMGSLLVGVSFAKGFAASLGIPMIEVNHLQGHVLAHFIKERPTPDPSRQGGEVQSSGKQTTTCQPASDSQPSGKQNTTCPPASPSREGGDSQPSEKQTTTCPPASPSREGGDSQSSGKQNTTYPPASPSREGGDSQPSGKQTTTCAPAPPSQPSEKQTTTSAPAPPSLTGGVGGGSSLPPFPFLCLLVSGGNSQIVLVKAYNDMQIIGQTIDDAAGEAIDKCSKVMGLGYPGGPIIDRLARQGNPDAYHFAKPAIAGYNYSFSGLKTSFLYNLRDWLKDDPDFIEHHKEDLAASLEKTIVDILMNKLRRAAKDLKIKHVAVAGGVSANTGLREAFKDYARRYGWTIYIPKFSYTTDNAAMIAITGAFKYADKDFCPMEAPAYSRMEN